MAAVIQYGNWNVATRLGRARTAARCSADGAVPASSHASAGRRILRPRRTAKPESSASPATNAAAESRKFCTREVSCGTSAASTRYAVTATPAIPLATMRRAISPRSKARAVSSGPAFEPIEELDQMTVGLLGLLLLRPVAALVDDDLAHVRHPLLHAFGHRRREHRVERGRQHERRRFDD